ncbi:DUF3124 domain-containing protein [Cochleicola gelatinilyticus]|uniref:DUF3124 domain-containing protein n=1 Tax=Cochleicola gelatinilyticus TaxID=1763537 RepID=A0A167IRH5_9FLAO|nr:DUF3124 domain-containing protein [Cochleicola gelatinilyticus]OAB79942.1 hypothetical protein ULVI_04175 [Cochleicola gelatinilyticus]
MKKLVFILLIVIGFQSCVQNNPLHPTEIKDVPAKTMGTIEFDFPVEEEVYVPIYSDIFHRTRDFKILLAATLSIRNTSKSDTLFIKEVDYYDSAGIFVRDYIKEPIYLNPLETIDYVIDEEDEVGGSGANFLITWGANKNLKPVFQAVMVGGIGQQGITFTTEGTTVTPEKEISKTVSDSTQRDRKK